MKDKFGRIFPLFYLLFGLLFHSALAKSYFYPKIKTKIYLLTNGDVRITQERTYNFSGSFSWAFIQLKKKPAKDIVFNRLAEITAEGVKVLEPEEKQDNENSLYLRWRYQAEDEEKTFLLDYTIIGGVKRYSDVAEFYWKIIEEQHERISRMEAEVFLPQPSPELFKIYIHSRAKPGLLTFNENNDQATVKQDNIPKDAFVEIRILTSPHIFPLLSEIPEERYRKILAQEKKNFFFSLLRSFVFLPLGLFLIFILPFIILIFFYYLYGREPKLLDIPLYEHQPPRLAPPVTLPLILNQKPTEQTLNPQLLSGMFATLLQLASKGYLQVKEIPKGNRRYYEWTIIKPEEVRDIGPFHFEVVNFFFQRVSADKKTFTDEELKEYLINHPKEITSFFADLASRAKSWWEMELQSPLFDLKSAIASKIYLRIVILLVILGLFFFGSGLSSLPPFSGSVSFFFALPAVIMIVLFDFLRKVINRWSESAYREHRCWLSFKRFLTDFSAIRQAPITLLAIWEDYYVYATVLGVAKHFLKNLRKLGEERNMAITLPVWYNPASKSLASLSEGLSQFNEFTNNFTNLIASFSSTTSSGGGFSGGGGGGGGGGTSGAG